ncbi:GPR1 [Candida theae]|uniref:GPR1 n=1 Tax=Candida theae TaxID=1198502 RepID=A0AAD5BEN2_9ASCO|nr:GPR1 [Candida theae]KAI5957706.1 GPR1 [Candida theae]
MVMSQSLSALRQHTLHTFTTIATTSPAVSIPASTVTGSTTGGDTIIDSIIHFIKRASEIDSAINNQVTRFTHHQNFVFRVFCQVVGFFTATAIEGADIAIFAFALHTFLLIFKPSLNTRSAHSNRVEGGLYKMRYLVYALSVLIPLVLASLAFINSMGYDSLVCWCYLPMRPVWYRLVLSWVPRWCIVVAIFVFYGLIYIRVVREFKSLGGDFTNIHQRNAGHFNNESPTFFASLKFFFGSIKDHLFPKMLIPEDSVRTGKPATAGVILENGRSRVRGGENESDTDEVDDLEELADDYTDSSIKDINLQHFERRQKVIEKQMKTIFIYPFAYCFLWLFPFILQCTQFNYEETHQPVYWLNVLGAFFQPFSGVVDSTVFFLREKPWRNTAMRNFEKEHRHRVDNIIQNSVEQHRYSSVPFSNTQEASERIARNSVTASTALVDLDGYKAWRRVLNRWKFPLFQLPTQENIFKVQDKYITKILREKEENGEFANFGPQNPKGAKSNFTMMNEKPNSTTSNDDSELSFPPQIHEKYSNHKFEHGSSAGTIPTLSLPQRRKTSVPVFNADIQTPQSPSHVDGNGDEEGDEGSELDFTQFLKS